MKGQHLAAMAVGMIFAPLAVAQTVSINGVLKVAADNYKIGNPNPARAGLNTSENRVTDSSSQIHINISKELRSGLSAIGKVDMRLQPDSGGGPSASGNTWVGARSSAWGTLTVGRHDLHYGKTPDEVPVKGALTGSSSSLMHHVSAGAVAIAGTSRTHNVIRWDSPDWSGAKLTLAWSTNPFGKEAELTTGGRSGRALNINPSYAGSNFLVGYSLWRAKQDALASTAAAADQESDHAYGYYRFGSFKVGLGWDRSTLVDPIGGGDLSKRTSWALPVAWFAGPHTIAATYSRAGDDDVLPGDQKASELAVAYSYDLSKELAVSLTYARISNAPGAAYSLYTTKSTQLAGSENSTALTGEDPQIIAVAVRYVF